MIKESPPHSMFPPTHQHNIFLSLPRCPLIGVLMTESLVPHPFLELTNAKDQKSECPQHGGLLLWPVQSHGVSGAQYVLQGLKGFASQQVR